MLPKRVVLYGGTGQAKIIRSILKNFGSEIEAVIDETQNMQSPFLGVPIYYSYEEFKKNHKKLESSRRTDNF